jgi:hypothetical protein
MDSQKKLTSSPKISPKTIEKDFGYYPTMKRKFSELNYLQDLEEDEKKEYLDNRVPIKKIKLGNYEYKAVYE